MAGNEALSFIRDMQISNGECELPCWWGITPGKTSWEEAKRVLAPLRRYKSKRTVVGVNFPEYSNMDVSLYDGSDKLVREIWVFASRFVHTGTELISVPFDDSWQRYSLNSLFKQHGLPSDFQVGFDPNDVSTHQGVYELHVFYDELGLIIRYGGEAKIDNTYVHACFDLDTLTSIRVVLQKPPSGGFPGPPWDYQIDPKTIEEATTLTLASFYRENNKCLKSPVTLWPISTEGDYGYQQ